LYFFDTTNDLRIPSIWLLAVRTGGSGRKSFTVGGADLTVAGAVKSALRELSGQFQKNASDDLDPAHVQSLADDPTRVTTISDHAALYASDDAFPNLDFLDLHRPPISADAVQARSLISPASAYDLRTVLVQISEHLAQLGSELLLKDMSLPFFQDRRLHCVRALAPHVYPMSFGYTRQRFAISDRLHALSERYGSAPIRTLSDLNPHVHPFA
jgi:ribosomal protein S12 methylthiotransferase accessory factor YcaO